jgi:glycosyltransferase involved in cell wall biosynthesis
VAAFARGGPAEIIEDDVSGLLAQEDDLVPTLLRLAHNHEHANRLARAGSSRAMAFDAKRSTSEFQKMIEGIASPPGGFSEN